MAMKRPTWGPPSSSQDSFTSDFLLSHGDSKQNLWQPSSQVGCHRNIFSCSEAQILIQASVNFYSGLYARNGYFYSNARESKNKASQTSKTVNNPCHRIRQIDERRHLYWPIEEKRKAKNDEFRNEVACHPIQCRCFQFWLRKIRKRGHNHRWV